VVAVIRSRRSELVSTIARSKFIQCKRFGSLARARSGFLSEAADVSDKILDLVGFQTFAIRRHFVFAIGDGGSQIGVALLLDIRGAKIVHLVGLADGGFPFSVGTVAGRTFGFEERFTAVLSVRGHGEEEQEDTG
jgi:hypothetical protein